MANKTETLIQTLTIPMQRFEDACIELLTQRALGVAVGAQLDALGKIVGQARQGDTDDVYRRYIAARVLVNRSTGRRQDLIAIAAAVLADTALTIVLKNEGVATARITASGDVVASDVAPVFAEMVQAGAPLGVRLVVEWAQSPPANVFRFDSGPGWDVGHLAGSLG